MDRTFYYVEYPRDFANEYDVFAVPSGEAARFEGLFPDATRITRNRADRLGWYRPREAKRDGEQWFGGYAKDDFADTLADARREAVKATARAMNHVEAERQFNAEWQADAEQRLAEQGA